MVTTVAICAVAGAALLTWALLEMVDRMDQRMPHAPQHMWTGPRHRETGRPPHYRPMHRLAHS